MKTTNVKATQLNYDHYANDKYDQDIINSIPFHNELHTKIINYVEKNYSCQKTYSILDLGVGTGITSKLIQNILPNSRFDLVDFSQNMLIGAKKKFGDNKKIQYILGDYSKLTFEKKYDLIISVIGIHHQNEVGKKLLFKKIYSLLNTDGIFIFGDLVTCKNPKKAAYNNVLHFHHLVDKATDNKTLQEWAYHHIELNDLSPIEDQIQWLREIGFQVTTKMNKMNTALLICKK